MRHTSAVGATTPHPTGRPRNTAFTMSATGPLLLDRDDRWIVVWNLRDEGRIDIQRLGDHVSWAVRQPIRQIHLLEPIRLEDLHVHKICVPNILDIVTKR